MYFEWLDFEAPKGEGRPFSSPILAMTMEIRRREARLRDNQSMFHIELLVTHLLIGL